MPLELGGSMESTMNVVYSRPQDGLCSVRVEPDPAAPSGRLYRVHRPEGLTTYPSARQLLIAMTGHPHGRHWTFDRYFHQGKYRSKVARVVARPENQPGATILDLFGAGPLTDAFLTLDRSEGQVQQVVTTPGLTVESPIDNGCLKVADGGLTLEPSTMIVGNVGVQNLGIDLQRRRHEVKKLLYAGFGSRIRALGFDPDDVLQEVYRGILVRNAGTCPWDARKSSFGHYVHMICGCVVSNYSRKQRRQWEMEQVGLNGFDVDGRYVPTDASGEAVEPMNTPGLPEVVVTEDFARHMGAHPRGMTAEAQLAAQILPLVKDGHPRAEIARMMGMSRAAISRALTYIRACARRWVVAADPSCG